MMCRDEGYQGSGSSGLQRGEPTSPLPPLVGVCRVAALANSAHPALAAPHHQALDARPSLWSWPARHLAQHPGVWDVRFRAKILMWSFQGVLLFAGFRIQVCGPPVACGPSR